MCGISGARTIARAKELAEANLYRGNRAFSLTLFVYDEVNEIKKYPVPFNSEEFETVQLETLTGRAPSYFLLHVQAPTKITDLTEDEVHPSIIVSGLYGCETTFLWHNGMLLPQEVSRLAKQLNIDTEWDTRLLHTLIDGKAWDEIGKLKGSFACVYSENSSIYLLRNQIAPLYVSADGDISSSPFEGGDQIAPGVLHRLNLQGFGDSHILHDTGVTFNPSHLPFFLG